MLEEFALRIAPPVKNADLESDQPWFKSASPSLTQCDGEEVTDLSEPHS